MLRTDYATLTALSTSLCKAVAENVIKAVNERGSAVLVLSGGRTPEVYLPELFAMPLPWEHVHITLSDERWVPPTHPDSNEGLIRRLMPEQVAQAASFTSLWAETPSPHDSIAEISSRLDTLPHPLDVAILGMGEDGHFASLFPGTGAALSKAPNCVAVNEAPAFPRMSLSAGILSSIRHIHLAVTGTAKLEILERAAENNDPDGLPVSLLLALPTQDRLSIYAAP